MVAKRNGARKGGHKQMLTVLQREKKAKMYHKKYDPEMPHINPDIKREHGDLSHF